MQKILDSTPHLTTALTGPLHLLEKQLLAKQDAIEEWFRMQWQLTPAPVYGSVDLRNAGFKLAPIDMNLFPAGFNNLNKEFFSLSAEAAKETLLRMAPQAKRILLIPESHTRNVFYWENIHALLKILIAAGFEARLGSLLPDYVKPAELQLKDGASIWLETIVRYQDKIGLGDFMPDMILLNNDLSDGIPPILQNLQQVMIPPAELGWSQRLKSNHFQYYAQISEEFSQLLEIDSWFVAPLFRHCGEINFMNREGIDCLVSSVEILLEAIKKKYAEYNIPCKPFIIVKADAGTYGMAVMTVYSADELRTMNRKQRTAMSKTKSAQPVSRVIIQEGVYTFETWGQDNAVAEPVVYLWGERVVGGFYRVHKDRGVDENLNSPGMRFEPLAFTKSCHKPADDLQECQNRFYAYGVVARLSMLAAAREILELPSK